ncbi:RnfABCDGE type electron transport complex subunit G [Serpentinicella sp. ANB-PHB4]|uniref:RnfABCDGE type electron transport complex subunit G n=1 Tax=Serpentinicella sp. ANB-PHB4 TaxID=3074076 RepID=UPI00285478A7|nr:RnfABCDGE type electron transport complex subunit G [Serpentinicella sp. ANB-PHB4]MDR5657879.1 RnfABCDGE type electron transport complex subunit G [Serpentinicella sp. ANB-PHB4]
MKDMLKMGLILLAFTAVSGMILGLTNDVTQGIIQERLEEENIQAIAGLLPEAEDFNNLEDEAILQRDLIVEVYEGQKEDETVGYTVRANPIGYGGRVVVITGISVDGEILGVEIAAQSETPGLGDKITDNEYLDQYVGKSTEEELVTTKGGETGEKYINAITGATVSSEAVTDGVNAARALYEEVLKSR